MRTRRLLMLFGAAGAVMTLAAATLVAPAFAETTSSGPTAGPAGTIAAPARLTPAAAAAEAAVSGTGHEQCALPAAARKGAWTCLNTSPASAGRAAKEAQAKYGRAAVTDAEVAAVTAADTGFCTIEGCWKTVDSYRVSYTGTGWYGYGSTTLGDITMYFKVTSSGSYLITYPFYYKSTRGTKTNFQSVEVLYLSAAYPGGNAQSPRQTVYQNVGGRNAEQYVNWPSPGAKWRQTVQQPSVAAEIAWQDPSSAYPGEWFLWAKSITFRRQANATYLQTGNTPSNNADWGWEP